MLGISLLKLVYTVSEKEWNKIKRKKYNHFETNLEQAQKSMLKATDEDVRAYQTNFENNFNNPEHLKQIIAIPLKVARTAATTLDISNQLSADIKNTVQADYQVAELNLKTSIKGAISIIKSNYIFFPQESKYIKEIQKEIGELEQNYSRFKTRN